MKFHWIFQIPLEDVQTTKNAGNGCFLCGKKLKSKKFQVQLLTNGNLVSSDEAVKDSQGFFDIGSECKNKLPNNFYFDSSS